MTSKKFSHKHMTQATETNPIEKAMARLNLDTMMFSYTQHAFGGRPAIPRGWCIRSARLKGAQLTLFFSPYYVESSLIAQQMFGVPALVNGQILDWDVDIPEDGPWQVVQIPEGTPDVPIIVPIKEVE